MRYCPDCGTGHDCTAEAAAAPNPEVEIARINAERDVKVAQIGARESREMNDHFEAVAEIEADAQVETAIAEAEVIGAAIESGAVAEESAEPVIIDVPPAADDGGDAEELPPAEGSPAPEPAKRKSIGLGAW